VEWKDKGFAHSKTIFCCVRAFSSHVIELNCILFLFACRFFVVSVCATVARHEHFPGSYLLSISQGCLYFESPSI